MENMERLIPVVALLGVAVFLLFLLRLARSERREHAKQPEQTADAPLAVPLEVQLATPIAVSAPEPVVTKAVAADMKTVAKTSPVQSVLDALKTKDALVKAFLLREILDPPVSRRRRAV